MQKKLSVVLPAYNEGENIGKADEQLKRGTSCSDEWLSIE